MSRATYERIMLKLHRQFDTPCLFGRDIKKFGRLVSAWYGDELVHGSDRAVSSAPYSSQIISTPVVVYRMQAAKYWT